MGEGGGERFTSRTQFVWVRNVPLDRLVSERQRGSFRFNMSSILQTPVVSPGQEGRSRQSGICVELLPPPPPHNPQTLSQTVP